jgi:predicted acyl esterase
MTVREGVDLVAGVPPEQGGYPGFATRTFRDAGLMIEHDILVPMRDGHNIEVDIFRPDSQTLAPAIIAWSPYGKHSPKRIENFPGSPGVARGQLSKYTAFEAPDPVEFGKHGLAVINVNPRGLWNSTGDAVFYSQQEIEDASDLIAWLAAQPWCNGKIGMAGVSYLAKIQWSVAATQPPELCAINPWEGASDSYREGSYHGGIPETNFAPYWQVGCSYSRGRVENTPKSKRDHHLFDEYWRARVADWSKITVPAYVVASWTDQGLHTRGTLEAYKALGSQQKWLDIHGQKKWGNYYKPESIARQIAFFRRFLLDDPNEVDTWPRVRLEVRDRYGINEERAESEWPLARTEFQPLYLDADNASLTAERPSSARKTSYEANDDSSRIVFDYRFAETTEMTGHMKLRLFVSAVDADDMDIFVGIEKLDIGGNKVGFAFFGAYENGPVALGWLRVSHRELDPIRSRPEQPYLKHSSERRLTPGEIVPVDIEIWPSGTRFSAGETLRLVIQGTDLYKFPPGTPTHAHISARNNGCQIIYTGGDYDSHLLIPVIRPKARA